MEGEAGTTEGEAAEAADAAAAAPAAAVAGGESAVAPAAAAVFGASFLSSSNDAIATGSMAGAGAAGVGGFFFVRLVKNGCSTFGAAAGVAALVDAVVAVVLPDPDFLAGGDSITTSGESSAAELDEELSAVRSTSFDEAAAVADGAGAVSAAAAAASAAAAALALFRPLLRLDMARGGGVCDGRVAM